MNSAKLYYWLLMFYSPLIVLNSIVFMFQFSMMGKRRKALLVSFASSSSAELCAMAAARLHALVQFSSEADVDQCAYLLYQINLAIGKLHGKLFIVTAKSAWLAALNFRNKTWNSPMDLIVNENWSQQSNASQAIGTRPQQSFKDFIITTESY